MDKMEDQMQIQDVITKVRLVHKAYEKQKGKTGEQGFTNNVI